MKFVESIVQYVRKSIIKHEVMPTPNRTTLSQIVDDFWDLWNFPNWKIEFSWVKAHVGIAGNELADQLAKAAASDSEAQITFNRIPISTLLSEIEEEANKKWQKEWKEGTKAVTTRVPFRSAG